MLIGGLKPHYIKELDADQQAIMWVLKSQLSGDRFASTNYLPIHSSINLSGNLPTSIAIVFLCHVMNLLFFSTERP